MKKVCLTLGVFMMLMVAAAQQADSLVRRVKTKLAAVRDYQAEATMKTDVAFMKVPDSKITVYYRSPNQFKIAKQDGISIVPKGGVSINLNSLFAGDNFTAVAAGKGTVNGKEVSIIKLLPMDEKSDIVIASLYIDEKDALIRKAITTTRTSGTYEIEMSYGKYATWGLPDKVKFVFALKDYKLPKGLAFDYDTGEKTAKPVDKDQKGNVEITYASYTINKGVPDSVFQAK
ncbi:MAG: hypothetical protein QM731_17265 [Chitinophagaceae bacterium]